MRKITFFLKSQKIILRRVLLVTLLHEVYLLHKEEDMGRFYSVPLYRYEGWLGGLYWGIPAVLILCGILQMLIKEGEKRKSILRAAGLLIGIGAVFLMILSGQPYPAVLYFALLLGKGIAMIPGVSRM